MFEKTQYASSIILGCSVQEQPFFLSDLRAEEQFVLQGKPYSGYVLTLQDRTGEISAFIMADKVTPEYSNFVNRVVSVNGVCLKSDSSVFIKAESLTLIEEGNYNPKEFMIGLTAEKRQKMINLFKREIEAVNHPGYKALLSAIFTDEVINVMADRPASLKAFANYHGGLLVSATTINHMCRNVAGSYMSCTNGIYGRSIDVDLLSTAALLHGVGKIREWTDFPFKKSREGKLRGTVGTLQNYIQEMCRRPDVNLSMEDEEYLISSIIPAIDGRNQVKAVSKEAVILQQVMYLYRTCDEYDKAILDYQGEEDIFYSWQLKAYVKNEKVG